MADSLEGMPKATLGDPHVTGILLSNMDRINISLEPQAVAALLLHDCVVPAQQGRRTPREVGEFLGYDVDSAHDEALQLLYSAMRDMKEYLPDVHQAYVEAKYASYQQPEE